MGFSRQEHWSGLLFLSPGDLPDPGVKPRSAVSPTLAGRVLTTSTTSTPQSSSAQSFSHVRLFATPWTAAHQASLSITSSRSLLTLMFIESVMPSNHLILFRSPLLPPSIFPSIRVFSNESALCIKYWSFSFSISPYNEYSGLISFRMDLLALQLSNMQY